VLKTVSSIKRNIKSKKNEPKKEKVKPVVIPEKKIVKVKKANVGSTTFRKYTGKPDTGWMYFGKPELKEKFQISCADDKPRKVKRKAISKSNKKEFMRGLYSKRISGDYGDNYVEIYPVYMYDNGALPQSNPVVTVYGSDRKVQRLQTTVNAYRGKKGILYRIFINGKKNMQCMDLVIPYGTKKVSYGAVYVEEDDKLQEYKFKAE